jgi:opacity protein-like surface antigen
MRGTRVYVGVALLVALLALPAFAEDEPAPDASAREAEAAAEPEDADAAEEDEVDEEASEEDDALQLRWSLTPTGVYHWIDSDEDDDDVTGFFDQYEFVPNKSSAFPFELGVRDAAVDLLGENETPLLQFRLESPTSNLGISGSQIDDPFFNQRALLLGRLPGFDLDLRYRRLRTEETRLFPNTAGAGLLFDDRSDANDRFARERTGFDSELRARPGELYEPLSWLDDAVAPELSLRGGYEVREGHRQLRFLIEPSNEWIGLAQGRDQEVGDVGAGLLLAPGRLFTLSLDFDHQRFRENESPTLQSSLGGGVPATQNTIAFVPDTDRYTGTLMLRGRIGERAVLEGGFQGSLLEQVDDDTPFQRAADLRENQLVYYSANVTADVALAGPVSANAFFKFDQRDNDIDRDTTLFGDDNGTQVGPFYDRWQRLFGGAELVYRLNAANRVALGGRFESIDRSLDYAQPECPPLPCFPAVLATNSLVGEESETYTVYASARLRMLRRIGVSGELGYRIAPETGYVTDLDDYVYGKLRASYTVPIERPVVLSLFAQGGSGENRNQEMVSGGGLGVPPAGPDVRRDFDRTDWLVGLSANASPWDPLGVFASFFVSQDVQDYELVLSDLQRYLQPLTPITFANAGLTDYENLLWSVVLGTHYQFDEDTDAALSYSFTRADSSYSAGGSPLLALVNEDAEIDSDIHGADVEIGHWLRPGLRLLAGYRFQYYDDGTDLPESIASAVVPFDLNSTRHTVTLGVTLTSALLE